MANYYLQDSSTQNWQLGVTALGQITTTAVGAESIITLTLMDLNGVYWQLGVTTLGQLTLTSTGVATVNTINLTDSLGNNWNVQPTILGQLQTIFLSGTTFPSDMTPGTNIVIEIA